MIRYFFITFFLITFFGTFSKAQIHSSINHLDLQLPCKIKFDLQHEGIKSYSCMTYNNSIPKSYRIDVLDNSKLFKRMSNDMISSFKKGYLNDIYNSNLNNDVKRITFLNKKSVQFDYKVDLDGLTMKSRTVIFFINNISYTINIISDKENFNDVFYNFKQNISLNKN